MQDIVGFLSPPASDKHLVLSTLVRKTEEVGPTGINLMEASESWSELL